jgi:hypothetical protein
MGNRFEDRHEAQAFLAARTHLLQNPPGPEESTLLVAFEAGWRAATMYQTTRSQFRREFDMPPEETQ